MESLASCDCIDILSLGYILPLAKNLHVIFFLSTSVLLPLSLPFPFPFLSSGYFFGLGVGLTGVASSVSPITPDGFGFGFFGSLGASVAFALRAGSLGLRL